MALTQGLELPFGIQPVKPVPVDSYSGPYTGSPDTEQGAIDAANAAIPANLRFKSMEVRLVIGGTAKKYWYKDGTANTDLVEFVGSNISVANASDNRVLTSTGTSLGINAESNLTFDGTDLTVTGDINVNGATSADIKTTTVAATVFNQPTTLSLGAAATSLTIGGVTTAATTNISTGEISTGTKSIGIGTNGLSGSTTSIGIGTASGGTSTTTINGNTVIGNTSSNTLTIKSKTLSVPNDLNIASNTLYIDSGNNYVGVNNITPAYPLDVSGRAKVYDILVANNQILAGTTAISEVFCNSAAIEVIVGSVAATNRIGGLNTGSTEFYIGANGTSTGNTKEIYLGTGSSSGSTTTITIGSSGGTSTTKINGNFETNGNTTIGDALADSLTIKAGTISLPNGSLNLDSGTLYVDATNNRVGIVNSSPSTALDVTGDLTVSGDIAVNGGDITTTSSTLSIGKTTSNFTANLATGLTASGSSKTVNVGTGSDAGSTTNVNIGSSLGTSTTTISGILNADSGTLYLDPTVNRVGFGTTTPKAKIDVYSTTGALFRTTSNATNGTIRLYPLGDGNGARIDFGQFGTGDGTNFTDYGDIGAYGTSFNINAKGRDLSFKIDSIERMSLSSASPYSLNLTDGSILMNSTSARAITHTGASGQNLTISSTNGNVLVESSTFSGNNVTIPGYITFGGTTALRDSGSATAISLPGSGNVTVAGALRVDGDAIKDSNNNSAIAFTLAAGVTSLITFNSDIRMNLPVGSASSDISSNIASGTLFCGASNTGTISLGTNAATVSIGSSSGNTSVNNDLTVSGINISSNASYSGGTSSALAQAISGNESVVKLNPSDASHIHYKLPTTLDDGAILIIKNFSTTAVNLYTGQDGQTIDGKYTGYNTSGPTPLQLLGYNSASSGINSVILYCNNPSGTINWYILSSHRTPLP